MSTSSTKSPSMVKDRDWWSADFLGEMEQLEVEESFLLPKADSWTPKGGRTTGQLGRCLRKKKVKK